MPIEELIGDYDFITIDHPYMGQAEARNLLVNLNEKIPEHTRCMHAKQSVGPSFQSYTFKNNLYALPVDAAALVAACREDILLDLGLINLPKSRQELLGFYKKLPSNVAVAWPLCPTDLWCAFLTLGAQDGGRDFINDYTIDSGVGTKTLDEIKQHLDFIHPESINWNPIHILDRMGEGDDIIYSPYLFGYSNYSRRGYSKHIVYFTDSPANPANDVSTVLGGAGLAISVESRAVEIAVEFVDFVANPDTQEGIYTREGGQPGNLRAWTNKDNNEMCSNFFTNTLRTMERAYMRPRHAMWNSFQEQGADLLHEGILKNIESTKLIVELNELYHSVVHHGYHGQNI